MVIRYRGGQQIDDEMYGLDLVPLAAEQTLRDFLEEEGYPPKAAAQAGVFFGVDTPSEPEEGCKTEDASKEGDLSRAEDESYPH